MALEINKLVTEADDDWVEATERLCLTEDGQLVPETDPDARWLHCTPGTRIRRTDAERYGLLDETPAKPASKARRKPADKAVKGPEGDKAEGE